MSSVLVRAAAAAFLAAGCLAGNAQTVTPPPLPIGSAQVRPVPGLQEAERKRYVRAHHHKFEHKDPTRDDSVYGPVRTSGGPAAPAAAHASPTGGGSGGTGAPATDSGTSAGRVGGGKGASSWFYQPAKK